MNSLEKQVSLDALNNQLKKHTAELISTNRGNLPQQ